MDNDGFRAMLKQAREHWGECMELSNANVHAAAVGLAAQWYRNTETVEYDVHSHGPWGDRDMLRNNARVTALCRDALQSLVGAADELVLDVLVDLQEAIAATLPSEAARDALLDEKPSAPEVLTEWIRTNGLGNALYFLTTSLMYPAAWWGAPAYTSIVDAYCGLDVRPPDPSTFRDRMLRAPWELSDTQADFVCEYRYDIHGTLGNADGGS